jgi:hypothetical protein
MILELVLLFALFRGTAFYPEKKENVTKSDLVLSKECKLKALRLRQKSWYYELRHYIKRGENRIVNVYAHDRQSGKTYTLIQLALEFNCPIIVGSLAFMQNIHSMCSSLGIPKGKIKVFVAHREFDCIEGLKFPLILVEENVTDDPFYRKILSIVAKDGGCVIGFYNPTFGIRDIKRREFALEYKADFS